MSSEWLVHVHPLVAFLLRNAVDTDDGAVGANLGLGGEHVFAEDVCSPQYEHVGTGGRLHLVSLSFPEVALLVRGGLLMGEGRTAALESAEECLVGANPVNCPNFSARVSNSRRPRSEISYCCRADLNSGVSQPVLPKKTNLSIAYEYRQ